MTTTYKIKKGDTLWGLARKTKSTVSDILKMNPEIRNKSKIFTGQTIKILEQGAKRADPSKVKAAKILRKDPSKKYQDLKDLKKRVKFEDGSSKLMTSPELEKWKVSKRQTAARILRQKKAKITPAEIYKETIKGLPAATKKVFKTRLKTREELKTQNRIILETVKGLPDATKVVFKTLVTPVQKMADVFEKYNKWYFSKVKGFLKKGTPSDAELKKAINRIDELKKRDLPLEVKRKMLEDIINEMEVQ